MSHASLSLHFLSFFFFPLGALDDETRRSERASKQAWLFAWCRRWTAAVSTIFSRFILSCPFTRVILSCHTMSHLLVSVCHDVSFARLSLSDVSFCSSQFIMMSHLLVSVYREVCFARRILYGVLFARLSLSCCLTRSSQFYHMMSHSLVSFYHDVSLARLILSRLICSSHFIAPHLLVSFYRASLARLILLSCLIYSSHFYELCLNL